MRTSDIEWIKNRFEMRNFKATVEPSPTYGRYIFTLEKFGRKERFAYFTKFFENFEDKKTYVNDFINDSVATFNARHADDFAIDALYKKLNEKKGNTEMNKRLMNLADAKEVYLNYDGTIVPIRIESIRVDTDMDIEMTCTLPSVIDETACARAKFNNGVLNKMLNREKNYSVTIKDVIFNPPATIVFWSDGKKTVVKAGEHDIYDPEKGLAMAISKRVLGNEGNYYNEIRKWVEPYLKKCEENSTPVEKALERLGEALKKNCSICNPSIPIGKVTNVEQTEEGVKAEVEITDEKWKIWFEKRNDFDEVFGYDVYPTEYKNKSSARRRAKQIFNGTNIGWVVSKTDPWHKESDVSWQE